MLGLIQSIVGDENAVFFQVLPNPNICCSKPIGNEGWLNPIGTCLVDSPLGCPYLIGFGENHFCTHPHWTDFIKPRDSQGHPSLGV
jgi:hypothetical protein